MLMKNSSDTIGDRTRNLPACSAVPHQKKRKQITNNYATVIQRLFPAVYRTISAGHGQQKTGVKPLVPHLHQTGWRYPLWIQNCHLLISEQRTTARLLAVLAEHTGRSRALVHPARCLSAARDDTWPQFVAALRYGQPYCCCSTTHPAPSELCLNCLIKRKFVKANIGAKA
jgi:hypothetical protein